MGQVLQELGTFLTSKRRALASLTAFVLVFNGIFAVTELTAPDDGTDLAGTPGLVGEDGSPLPEGSVVRPACSSRWSGPGAS